MISLALLAPLQITNAGLAVLTAALTALQELGLDGTQVDGAGLGALVGLPDLRHLSLQWCRGVTCCGASGIFTLNPKAPAAWTLAQG